MSKGVEINSINKKIIRNIWPFILIIVLLLVLDNFFMNMLSDVRAYVGAESAYSKAQKQSTYYLARYAASHEEADFQQFLQSIAIPLADHIARISLQQEPPDFETAKTNLVKARNHPDDVVGMIKLFIRFKHTQLMQGPIAIWTQADIYVAQLKLAGDELHTIINKGEHSKADELPLLLEKINAINSGLSPLEDAFSTVLGSSSRQVSYFIYYFRMFVSAFLLTLGILLIRRIILKSEMSTIEILENENKLRALLNSSMDAVVQMNQDGLITLWSSQAANIFGWNADEAIGQSMQEMIIPPKFRHAHEMGIKKFMMLGEAKLLNNRIEISALRRDGTEFPVEFMTE